MYISHYLYILEFHIFCFSSAGRWKKILRVWYFTLDAVFRFINIHAFFNYLEFEMGETDQVLLNGNLFPRIIFSKQFKILWR